MTQRDKFVAEIKRMEQAMSQTDSMYLRKDYNRGIKRMKRELLEYDRFHGSAKYRGIRAHSGGGRAT